MKEYRVLSFDAFYVAAYQEEGDLLQYRPPDSREIEESLNQQAGQGWELKQVVHAPSPTGVGVGRTLVILERDLQ
jgi:Domain of unknown function (DUF4177)